MTRRAVIACAATLLAVPVFLLATPTIAHADSGLQESSTTTYTVDPAARAVHVSVDIRATNTVPDRYTSRGVERAYYPGLLLPALAEATNFHAVNDAGSSLSVTTKPSSSPIAQDVEVHFPNLYYHHTEHVRLDFDLPNGAPRSKSLTRVTAAFATFSAWASSPSDANVVIVVPKAFTVDIVGNAMTKQTTATSVTYTANQIGAADAWYVTVSARDDAKLARNDITVSNHPVDIRAFPDDPAWGSFVERHVRSGLPALEKLIGLPWPQVTRLLITETVTPYLYGYGGWYTRSDNTIEIGDALDAQVVLHEVSHAWFNSELFNERWIDEGLAQEYAARAVAATGGKLDSPSPVNQKDPAAVRLESWTNVDVKAQNSEAREKFGYNASWYVIRRVTKDVGVDGMRRVFAAALKEGLPYAGDAKVPGTNPEAAGGAGSWKRLLDYLDETGGARAADALFAKYVASPGDTSFAERAAARRAYAELVGTSNGWAPPVSIRESMTDWNFSTATTAMTAAQKIVATRKQFDSVASAIDLSTPERLRLDYEYRVSDLAAVQTEANADLRAAKTLVAATKTVDGSHGLLAKIGLLGANHKSKLKIARDELTSGDGAGSILAANAATKTVHDAKTAGLVRVVIAIAVVIVLALLVWTLRRWRRRRAARAAARDFGGPDPAPANGEVTMDTAG